MLTIKSAAAVMGVSEGHLRKMVGSGKIPATKLGRDWIIDEKALDLTGYVKGKHRIAPSKVDEFCHEVIKVWIDNPPEIAEGWLEDMVDKLVETCKNPTVTETIKATAPVPCVAVDTVADAESQADEDLGTAEEWAAEITEQIREEQRERNKLKWLVHFGGRIPCSGCGRKYFRMAFVSDEQGRRLCPSCILREKDRCA